MKAPAWSYSSLTSFETCPKRHYHLKVAKDVVEAETEVLRHGNEVHKSLELAVKGEKALPEKHAQYHPLVQVLRKPEGKKLIEWKFGITASFKPTEFFAKDVWCRGVIDYGVVNQTTATLVDHKTGKPKSDGDQLKLFAGAAFASFPYVERVNTAYAWLAHNKLTRQVFLRADVPSIWEEFCVRVRRMEDAYVSGAFPPRPSGLCRAHCPVPKSKCEFSGKD